MPYETRTENLVREILIEKGYRSNDKIKIGEKHDIVDNKIRELLVGASKSGAGDGVPDFNLIHTDYSNIVMIIECKGDIKNHKKKRKKNNSTYDADGTAEGDVLSYASFLSKGFDVIAIAISGEARGEYRITSFFYPKDSDNFRTLKCSDALSFLDYIELSYPNKEEKEKTKDEIIKFAKKLHNELRVSASLSEEQKPLLIGGILISLCDESFRLGYKSKSPKALAKSIVDTVRTVMEEDGLEHERVVVIINSLLFIETHTKLVENSNHTTILVDTIDSIVKEVLPFVGNNSGVDIVGDFYREFVRYSKANGQELGIVLTPEHITYLFPDLINLSTRDKVVDICCGTGGFLIAAMNYMIEKAGGDKQEEIRIKRDNLIGVEDSAMMFTLAASNMYMRGDGKATLFKADCFDYNSKTCIKALHPNVGFLNPPFSQDKKGTKDQKGPNELDFVENELDTISASGGAGEPRRLVAIVPISCATLPHPAKEKILRKHTLRAVMSMPNDLFHPHNVVTCIMVFDAGIPHNENPDFKTWFGYWKDDGFIKTKTGGRVDGGRWSEIRKEWLSDYRERKEALYKGVLRKVTAEDEWCAEAYLETDYTLLTPKDFEKELKSYILFTKLSEAI